MDNNKITLISLKEKVDKIEKDMVLLNNKLDEVLELLKTDCRKMSNHIDFIENVYDKVKYPFEYIMTSVNNVMIHDSSHHTHNEINY